MLAAGVALHLIPPASPLSMFSAWQPTKELRALIEWADVIHLHSLWSPMIVSVANHAIREGRPYLISTHGVLDHRAMWLTPFKRLKKQVCIEIAGIRRVLASAAGVVFGSEAEAAESLELASVKRLFIPNGVTAEMRRTALSDDARALFREIAPQVGGWTRSFLYYSRIHPGKGLDMLVNAFNAVASEFPDTVLFIAGIREDDAYLAQVESLIEHGGHRDRISLTTELTGQRGRFLHSACDIFVLPSHAEGFSVAMIEALAHGMPCLITKFCHAPLVESEGAGVIAEPNQKSIEQGLRQLLALTPDELAAMGKRARALFEAEYTWDQVAQKLGCAYRSAVESAERGG